MMSRIALSSSTACVNTNGGMYKRGKPLPLAEKLRIVGIFLDLQKQQPTKPVTRRQLATASNCGESSALKIMKEYRDTGVVSDPDDAHISRAHGVGSRSLDDDDIRYLWILSFFVIFRWQAEFRPCRVS
jgi:hypothetical protein